MEREREIEKFIPIEYWGIEALLKKRPQAYELEWHKGALHGFTFPERFCYHREAAERVWSKLFDLFERQLKSQPNS